MKAFGIQRSVDPIRPPMSHDYLQRNVDFSLLQAKLRPLQTDAHLQLPRWHTFNDQVYRWAGVFEWQSCSGPGNLADAELHRDWKVPYKQAWETSHSGGRQCKEKYWHSKFWAEENESTFGDPWSIFYQGSIPANPSCWTYLMAL